MEIIEILVAILTIIWSIINIILFFKIWEMTNNVKEIHDWIIEDRFKKQTSRYENSPKFTPNSVMVLEDLLEETVQTKSFNKKLNKGDKVTIIGYGTCTFEGLWEGKYAFYPVNTKNLPSSPYLVRDVEPYLLIPENKLTSVIE